MTYRATGEEQFDESGAFDTAAYIRALTIETMLIDIEQRVARSLEKPI